MGPIKSFIIENYRHFNAAALVDAAEGWVKHVDNGGKMFLTLGGAMSTAELGISIAELIRRDKVHAMCVTGANLEEDLFNLLGHRRYERIPHYRGLTAADDTALLQRGMNRVTDTCIPEDVMREVERPITEAWREADKSNRRAFPHEYFYDVINSGVLAPHYGIDPSRSWLVAAAERNLPLWVPGWEDSTLGNMYVSRVIVGELKGYGPIKGGLEQMQALVQWYREMTAKCSLGFFQVGGGISGDYPICVVPLIRQDLKDPVPQWGYFCQVSEATTSYGSYSGAPPNEKITWDKLSADTPRYIIESDATIVFPLVAQYVLGG